MRNKPQLIGPIGADHACIGRLCPGCNARFKAGDYVTLVPIGPGGNEAERLKARTGKPFNVVASLAHYACVTGEVMLDGQLQQEGRG
jgi:hypothetical protein